MKYLPMLLSTLYMLFSPGKPAMAATIYVPSDYTTIQAAVEAAGIGDTVMVAPGLYEELISFYGKNLCLMSQAGAENTVIRAPADAGVDRIERDVVANSTFVDAPPPESSEKSGNQPVVVDFGYGCDSTTVVSGFTVDGREAVQGMACRFSSPEIRDCIIENCYSDYTGGGIDMIGSAAWVHGNIIRNNEAYGMGGGIYFNSAGITESVSIHDNTISGNSAVDGAGICLHHATNVLCRRNIISNNYNHQNARYMYSLTVAYADHIRIINNTLSGNTGGLILLLVDTLDFRNNIVTGSNRQGVNDDDYYGPNTGFTYDYNDVWGNFSEYGYQVPAGVNDIYGDPLFDSRFPGEFYLTGGSPCINVGDPDIQYRDPDGSRCDIGARPYGQTPPPHTPVTLRVPADYGTIQEAINAAGYGDTIVVSAGTYVEKISFNGKSVRLVAPAGPEATIIQPPGGPSSSAGDQDIYIPVVTIPGGCDSTTQFSGFTVDGRGLIQGIKCMGSRPEISGCIIQNCVSYRDGGGIHGFGAGPTVTDNIIRWNYSPTEGGGIFIDNYWTRDSFLVRITGNTIYENDADDGPGILVRHCDDAVIRRNIVYRNDAYWNAEHRGAVSVIYGSGHQIVNNTIDGNLMGLSVEIYQTSTICNNIIRNNALGGLELDLDYFTFVDYNAVWHNGGNDYLLEAEPGSHDVAVDPGLVPGYIYAGYYLSAGSPCIDAGRPLPQYNDPDGSIADIGAVPYTPVDPYVPVVRSVPSQYGTIQEAIAASWHGDTILVAPGEYVGPLEFGGRHIALISEGGADATIIRAPAEAKIAADPRRRAFLSRLGDLDYLPGEAERGGEGGEKLYEQFLDNYLVFVGLGSEAGTMISGFTFDGGGYMLGLFVYGGDVDIRGCIIQNCWTTWFGDGSALYCVYSSSTIEGNIIRGNYSADGGAGVILFPKNGGDFMARIAGNRIYGNYARFAPGIVISQGAGVVVERNLVHYNIVSDTIWSTYKLWGAVYAYESRDITVVNNTIADNTQGISTYNTTAVILNNIITDHAAAGLDIQDTEKDGIRVISHDYNIFWDNAGGDFINWAAPEANELFADPMPAPWYPGEYYLMDGSPCIDAGHPDPQYNDPDGSRCDIGARPYQPISPPEPKTWYVPGDYGSIQATIEAAGYGDTILVAPGTYVEHVCLMGRSIVLASEAGPEATAIVAPDVSLGGEVCEYDIDFLPAGPSKEIIASGIQDSFAVVTVIPGSDSTTVISGFRVSGNNQVRGIFCLGANITVRDCLIEYCLTSRDGAGMFFSQCAPRLEDNVVRHNFAIFAGAGIYVDMWHGAGGPVIRNNRIYDNTGLLSPGLVVSNADNALLERNLVFGNLSKSFSGFPGAVGCRGNNITVRNNTIYGNTVGVSVSKVDNFDFRNNLVCENIYIGVRSWSDSVDFTCDYNNVWRNHEYDFSGGIGPGPNGISVDPALEPAHSGGFYLSPGSPCIDAGDPDPLYNDPDGSRADIGAVPFTEVEFPAPAVRMVPGEYATLQDAVDAAAYGDTVLVAPGVYQERASLCGKSLVLISQAGREETIIRAPEFRQFCNPTEINWDNLPWSLRVTGLAEQSDEKAWAYSECPIVPFGVLILTSGTDTTSLITGFTIDGNLESRGIYCEGANPEIRDCIIENGMPYSGSWSNGGGMAVHDCSPVIRDNIIRNNLATGEDGGAIFMTHEDNTQPGFGTPRIIGNLITGNSSLHRPGIYLDLGYCHDTVFISGNIVAGNFATGLNEDRQAAIHCRAPLSVITIINNTVTNNSAGIYLDEDSSLVLNNLVCGNDNGGIKTDYFGWAADYNNAWDNGAYDYRFHSEDQDPGPNNISADPLFDPYAPGEYLLSVGSPCIDAGHPDTVYNDPDGSRNDIGALPYRPTAPHEPVVIHVPLDFATIQEAIAVAGHGDTVLVAPGVYEEQIDFLGKSIVLLAEGKADETIIRAPAGKANIPDIVPSVEYDDVLMDVDSAGEAADKYGPIPQVIFVGEACDSTTVIGGFTIDGRDIMLCIRSVGSSVEIRDCVIEHGFSQQIGGMVPAVYIYTESGSGLNITRGHPYVHDNVLQYNAFCAMSVRPRWGGLPVRIVGNVFHHNTGGPFCLFIRAGSGVIVERNIFYANASVIYAGDTRAAVTIGSDSVSFVNNTLVGNHGGITLWPSRDVDIRNNIIAFSSLYGLFSGSVADSLVNLTIDYNNVFGNVFGDYVGPISAGDHDLSIDPGFDPFCPGQYRLADNSPCIDAGDPDSIYDDSDGSRNDIGAVPNIHIPTVLRVPSEYATIQEAIDDAGYRDTILIAPGMYAGYFTIEGKQIVVASSGGATVTTLTAPTARAGAFGEAVITVTAQEAGMVTLMGLTVDGGGAARGISCEGSDAVVSNCVFVNCHTWMDGGALHFAGCSPEVRDNVIHDCYAGSMGAGIYIDLADGGDTAVVQDNAIYDNSGGNNAGLAVVYGTHAVVARNLIYNNSLQAPTDNRGALFVHADSVRVINNTIDGNTRGIVVREGCDGVDVRNNIITNNASGGVDFRTPPGRSVPSCDYNDIWNNGGVDYLGLAVAGEHDISLDPQFRANLPGAFLLAASSACIDAGDPDPVYNDTDGSRCDMGANPYTETQCGDANSDGGVNIGDAVFIITFVFKNGPGPEPICIGDANGDDAVNVGDAVYLITFIFKKGSAPVGDCCTATSQ